MSDILPSEEEPEIVTVATVHFEGRGLLAGFPQSPADAGLLPLVGKTASTGGDDQGGLISSGVRVASLIASVLPPFRGLYSSERPVRVNGHFVSRATARLDQPTSTH
jgi:hypothetical protein